MKIDKATIKHVANLARLDLTDAEIEEFTPQLAEVLDAFSKLDELDTAGVKPSFHPVELEDMTREDKKTSCLPQEEALANSPNTKDRYFKGPRAV